MANPNAPQPTRSEPLLVNAEGTRLSMQLSFCRVHSIFGAASQNIRVDDLGRTAVWLSSCVLLGPHCPHLSSYVLTCPLLVLWMTYGWPLQVVLLKTVFIAVEI